MKNQKVTMNKVINSTILIFFILFLPFSKAVAVVKDTLDVYLSNTKEYYFNLVFDNKSNDTIGVYSCFKVFDEISQSIPGFTVIMYVNGEKGGISLNESFLLRFSNCKTEIVPYGTASFEIPINFYIPKSPDVKEVSIQLIINYLYIKKGVLHNEHIKTNSVIVFRKKEIPE